MAEFEVMPEKLREQAETLNDIGRLLLMYGQEVSAVSLNLSGKLGSAYDIIQSALRIITDQLYEKQKSTDSMRTALVRTAERYLNTETKIIDAAAKKETIEHPASLGTSNVSSGTMNVAAGLTASVDLVAGRLKGTAYANASVWEGSAGWELGNGLLQGGAQATAFSANAEAEASLDPFKIALGATASAAALNAKVTQSALWGLDKFEANGTVLGAEAEAKVYNTRLGTGASAEASAAVAKGEIERTFGLDKYHMQSSAEGSVLGAEAEASAGIGAYVDKDGNSQVGLHASAGAEAYVAKGEVKSSFTLFGVEISATMGGQIGAGVSAKAEVSSNSFKLGGSLAAFLGISAEFEIDWSNFGLW